MGRRQFLKLGTVATGTFAVGGLGAFAWRPARAQTLAVPSVDRLVMTTAVDNLYDVFAKAGKLETIEVQRARRGGDFIPLLAEHGLAYHLESLRGQERREILLDFGITDHNLFHNYLALGVDMFSPQSGVSAVARPERPCRANRIREPVAIARRPVARQGQGAGSDRARMTGAKPTS